MNWGTKLVIGMLCFMSFIVVLGVLMFNSKTDALVETDYYEKGLDYDTDYKRKEQAKIDDAVPEIQVTETQLILSFKSIAEGEVKLMRNADKRMDKIVTIKTDAAHKASIPLAEIAKGQWRLIISWKSDGKDYLNEQEVILK